jgi:hypothetical protein
MSRSAFRLHSKHSIRREKFELVRGKLLIRRCEPNFSDSNQRSRNNFRIRRQKSDALDLFELFSIADQAIGSGRWFQSAPPSGEMVRAIRFEFRAADV